MPHDDKATLLAELEVKRNRTLADLDAVREVRRATRQSLDEYLPRQDEMMKQYAGELEQNNLSEDKQQELYREWSEKIQSSVARFNRQIQEWERLQVQETILVRMDLRFLGISP